MKELEELEDSFMTKEETMQLSKYNVVFTTKSSIFYLNENLELLDSLHFNPTFKTVLPYYLSSGLSRVIFLEYIPEISCVFLGSSSCSKLLMLKLNKNKMIPMKWIPDENVEFPISGFSIEQDKPPFSWKLIISFMNRKVHVYQILNCMKLDFDISRIMI
jgi:hypothetical protein